MFATRSRVARAVSSVLAGSVAVVAQSPFASQVVSAHTNGNAGGGIFNPQLALGAPFGALDVHSLGIAGDLTLGFSVAIADGPGADLIVGENPFRTAAAGIDVFAEVMFVEVSTNGVDFVRFPSRYLGPAAAPGPFGVVPIGSYLGLAGQTPVLATMPGADPRDVVEAGGDAFDLADLAAEPLVQLGLVDLQDIRQVRLVDVPSGIALDGRGSPILDPGAGSADVDAVTAIHQRGLVAANGPRVALTIHTDGTAVLRLEDPDGWQDLDVPSLRAAVWGMQFPAGAFLASFQLVAADATGFTLVQPLPLPGSLLFTAAFSCKDLAGHRSGAARTRPLP